MNWGYYISILCKKEIDIMRRKSLVVLVVLILLVLVGLFLMNNRAKVMNICIPFIIGITIMYLIKPVLVKLKKIKIPSKYGILSIYAMFLVVLVCLVVFVLPRFADNTKELIIKMPEITTGYQSKFYKFINGLKIDAWPKEIKDLAVDKIRIESKNVQEFLINALKNILKSILRIMTKFFDLVLGMIIAYYLIVDEKVFKNMILMLVPKRYRNDVRIVGRNISNIVASFVRGQLLTAVIIGVLITIGLLVLKIDYALPLGLIAGISNIIPYFGPIIGAIPSVLVALLVSPVKVMWVLALMIFIQQIDNIVISPKVIEDKLGLHPVTTILSVLVGGEFFGVFGMLFGVLVVAILKVICNRVVEKIV